MDQGPRVSGAGATGPVPYSQSPSRVLPAREASMPGTRTCSQVSAPDQAPQAALQTPVPSTISGASSARHRFHHFSCPRTRALNTPEKPGLPVVRSKSAGENACFTRPVRLFMLPNTEASRNPEHTGPFGPASRRKRVPKKRKSSRAARGKSDRVGGASRPRPPTPPYVLGCIRRFHLTFERVIFGDQ